MGMHNNNVFTTCIFSFLYIYIYKKLQIADHTAVCTKGVKDNIWQKKKCSKRYHTVPTKYVLGHERFNALPSLARI